MILIFFLKMLQCFLGLLEYVLPPREQLGAKIFALALVHERLLVRRPIVFGFGQHFPPTPWFLFLGALYRPHRAAGLYTSVNRRTISEWYFRIGLICVTGQWLPRECGVARGYVLALTNARFGEFHRDAQIDFAQNNVKTGVARRFGQTLRCDPQARESRLVHTSVKQTELERVEHVERVAPLSDRALFPLSRVFHSLQRDERIDSRDCPQ